MLHMKGYFFVSTGRDFQKIYFNSILYIEKKGKFCYVHLENDWHKVPTNLPNIERRLPEGFFSRPHRHYIVSLSKVVSFDNRHVYLPEKKIEFDEQSKPNFLQSVTVHLHPTSDKPIKTGLSKTRRAAVSRALKIEK